MDRQPVKPPFAYYGGKTILAETIAALLPEHEHYVEPFAGSLAVLLAKQPSMWETVNDLDRDLVFFWQMLRDRPEDMTRVASLTPHSRVEREASLELDASDDLERARRIWVRLSQSRGNSMRPSGWRYRTDPATGTSMPDYLIAYTERLAPVARRLRKVSLECRDAVDVIREYGQHDAVCIYADPPYLGSTRRQGYRHELLGDDEHRALADALTECKASVVLSGYASPLYEELFDGWHRLDMKAPTTISQQTDRVEVLWSNRPLGEANLFDLLDGGAA